MVEVKTYHLPPTPMIPNSRYPLLVYPGALSDPSSRSPEKVWDVFTENGWSPQWIFRYGSNQSSHYHSKTHECMAVLSGSATIRFGVGDVMPQDHDTTKEAVFGDDDLDAARGQGDLNQIDWQNIRSEPGGIEIDAKAGDVFLIPAGVSHKTFNTNPPTTLALLTPGDGHEIAAPDKRATLAEIKLSGFTMLGAYPKGSNEWNYAIGGEDEGRYEEVWSVPKPESDPILGSADEGLRGHWK